MSKNGAKSRPCVGVVMLNTAFPRFPGDIGNPLSFDSMNVDVRYKVVDAATVARVVTASGIDENVTDALLEAVHEFSNEGVDLILTSCGFLSELQSRFQRTSSVPVVASSLELLPLLRRGYGDDEVIAVLTYDSRRLNNNHLGMISSSGAHATDGDNEDNKLIVYGMENASTFYTMIAESRAKESYDILSAEIISEAENFNQVYGDERIAALILECTNLSPYRQQIQSTLKIPVFDILDVARFFLSGIYSE